MEHSAPHTSEPGAWGAPRPRHLEPTAALWEGGEAARYVFRHMPEFFPHALVHRAGPVAALESAPDSAVAALPVDTRLGRLPLDTYVRSPGNGVDGVVIVQGGRVAYEAYPRMRPHDKHVLMSVSKPFASALVAVLANRGALDVDAPVRGYLPEAQGAGWEGVAVRDVLDMASGIDCHELSDGAGTDPGHPSYRYDASLGMRPPPPGTPASTYEFAAGVGRLRAPGGAFQYSSANTFVLAWLVERSTGRAYHEVLADEIWSRIGAEGDALIAVSPLGAPWADGGISATLRDVARFGLLFTPSRGAVSAEPVLPAWFVGAVQRGGRPALFAAGDGAFFAAPFGDDPPRHNAWQWDAVWPDGDFFKAGMGGQGLYVSPARDLVVAFVGTRDEPDHSNDLDAGARGLARHLARL